jgi:UDP-glucuronate decarboxylase
MNQKVIELTQILTDSESKIILMDLPENNPKQRQPDIAMAKKRLRVCVAKIQ